jgi:hypothetical protein
MRSDPKCQLNAITELYPGGSLSQTEPWHISPRRAVLISYEHISAFIAEDVYLKVQARLEKENP